MSSKPRIMIYGTGAELTSGYSAAVRYVSMLLKDRGYPVAVHAWNTFQGAPRPYAATVKTVMPRLLEWVYQQGGSGVAWDTVMPDVMAEYERTLREDTIREYGMGYTLTGWDILASHVRDFRADLVLVIADPWIHQPGLWKAGHNAKVVFWFPCQAEPASEELLNAIEVGDGRLCYSRWGTEVMRAGGATDTRYVPLGVNTHLYKPMDKAKARAWLTKQWPIEKSGIDPTDRFVVGMVAANSSTIPIMRKAFDLQLLAFARFVRDVDPDAVLYMHTEKSSMNRGIDLVPLVTAAAKAENSPMAIGKHVFFTNNYKYKTHQWDDADMALLYNACDAMLQATRGEGFGLPVLEAQACGVPVITANWSSMPELTRYGYKARVRREWAAGQMEGWVGSPDPDDIYEGLRRVRDQRRGWIGDPEDGLNLARMLDWSNVVDDYLLPELEGILNERPSEQGTARVQAAHGAV